MVILPTQQGSLRGIYGKDEADGSGNYAGELEGMGAEDWVAEGWLLFDHYFPSQGLTFL